MSDNWFYDYFINEVKNITRPCSGGSVPKPLTYDYMPEGYPSKAVQTTTLMAEQEVAFAFVSDEGVYEAYLTEALAIAEGQTYTVNWDGTEYECVCVCSDFHSYPMLGNPSLAGAGDDTGEPFIYGYNPNESIGQFITLDTAASHTISVKTVTEVITPMAYDYMPEGYPKKRGCSIEWDGNTEGLVAVKYGPIILYKVSDLTPTDDELIGRFVRISDGTSVIISSDYIHALSDDITFVAEGDPLILVVKKDNATVEGLTFPQKGTYFVKQQNRQQNRKAAQPKPLYVQKLTEVITPMAEEFMPPRIVEAIDNAQSTANNAQSTANNAVSYAFYQQLTDEQKKQARTNIGAGTSSFSPFKPAGKSYLTFSSSNSFTLKVNNSNKHWNGTLEYFASNKTWTTWNGTSTLPAINDNGEYVLYLRGTGNTVITGNSDQYGWILTGTDIRCIGNIENLLDYATVESGGHPTLAVNCYSYMFLGCTSLTQAPALPATALANNCYQHMFYGCTGLTQAPALPATTLASHCYKHMFFGCTGLTQAPALPATTLADYCYDSMFFGCTGLTQAPALPATTLADYCYSSMFHSCTGLTQAPALPATTLASRCYSSMFRSCTGLTQAPALPTTTLANSCYISMFYGCTSLTQAPALPATTLANSCYNSMFYGCTGLTQAPALPTTTLEDYCYNSMFYGCTSLTQAPALPATTLANSCYNSMFHSCTGLTQAPALPATTLADGCYRSMFHSCTGLKLSSTKTGEYTHEYRIPSSGEGATTSSALSDMFASTGGTFTGTPSINTTYYLSSDNMIVRETEIATLNGYVGSMIDAAIGEYSNTAEYIIPSSTSGSTKKFRITVDDTGTLSATEVT